MMRIRSGEPANARSSQSRQAVASSWKPAFSKAPSVKLASRSQQ